jgi:hypothetical protein
MEVEGAAAAITARASKVFLLRFPFGRLNLFLASLRDLVNTGGGTAEGRHDRVGLGKERLKVREEGGECPRQ